MQNNNVSRSPRRRAMRAATLSLAFAAAFAAGLKLSSGSELSTHFSVGATVQPHTTLRVKSQPDALAVAPDDVARGFIDVVEPTHVQILSNSPGGFALDFVPASALFIGGSVYGLGAQVALGPEGGTVVKRWSKPAPVALTLTYRFRLGAGVAPGRYPFPLQLSVRALDATVERFAAPHAALRETSWTRQ